MTAILLVEDDRALRSTLAIALRRAGLEVEAVQSGEVAAARLDSARFDVVLTDLRLPGIDGLEVLRRARRGPDPSPVVVVLTAFGTIDLAVEAMRLGALDFLTKPVDTLRLVEVVRGLDAPRPPRPAAARRGATVELVGSSPALGRAIGLIEAAAMTDASVLLLGETGTGKDLLARHLHDQSHRAGGAFVPVNCAGIPASLFESELFGHTRGAFTGADSDREGLVAMAHGGTLFLDEVAELPLDLQSKLLRVLAERAVRPVGGRTERPVDVRLVSATNRDLAAEVGRGAFREDLYFRLNVFPVRVPPLRERTGDVAVLAVAFAARFAERYGKVVGAPSPAALEQLSGYGWPGNVRELIHSLEKAVILAPGDGSPLDVPAPDEARLRPSTAGAAGLPSLDEVERRHILDVLVACGGNQRRACRVLGISKSTLRRKLIEYGVRPPPD